MEQGKRYIYNREEIERAGEEIETTGEEVRRTGKMNTVESRSRSRERDRNNKGYTYRTYITTEVRRTGEEIHRAGTDIEITGTDIENGKEMERAGKDI